MVVKIPNNNVTMQDAEKELVGMMAMGKYRNVLKFVGIINIGGKACFMTDFCEHGSLEGLHKKFDLLEEKRFYGICTDVLMGLMHLHSYGIVHRDIA